MISFKYFYRFYHTTLCKQCQQQQLHHNHFKLQIIIYVFFLHSHDLLIILFNQYGKFVVYNFIINHLDKYERIRQKKILKTSRRKYNELILVRSIRQHAYVDVLLSRAINEYLI